MTTEATPRDPEQRDQLVAFMDPFLDLLARATYTSATDSDVADMVVRAEHVIHALESVDDDQTLAAAEPARWKIGCTLSDNENNGMRELGIFMLIDVCSDHPEITGPLITRLAERLETALLDERPAAQLEAQQ